jgi:hypothetical protein
MDAAATRGDPGPTEMRMKEQQKRKRVEEEAKKEKAGKKQPLSTIYDTISILGITILKDGSDNEMIDW